MLFHLQFVLGHSTVPNDIWRNASFDAYNRVFNGRIDMPVPLEVGQESPFIPLPDDKILDWFKLKQIADDILKRI